MGQNPLIFIVVPVSWFLLFLVLVLLFFKWYAYLTCRLIPLLSATLGVLNRSKFW